jgi:dihydrofolate reductase
MKKVKLQMQLSLDGYVAGPNGEMDWMTWNWDDELKKYVTDLTDSMDTILMGRKMAGGFNAHWTNAASNPEDPSYAFAKIMVDTPKFVFSKTLDKSEWENTSIAKGDIAEEVKKLKNRNGKDIIAYGGAGFVSNMISQGLIDEYHLFVNPAVIGHGMPIFQEIEEKKGLKLVKAAPFSCGIVVLVYQPIS